MTRQRGWGAVKRTKEQPAEAGATKHKWAPSPEQGKVLAAAIEAGFDRNLSAIAKAAGVPRRTLYNWLEDDRFREAFENIWRVTLGRHVPGIISAQIKRAQCGDARAARLVLELMGILKKHHKHEHSGPGGKPIEHDHKHFDLEKLDDKELKDLERLTGKVFTN